MFAKSLVIATAAIRFTTSADAATGATAWTDLNLRAGPGPVQQTIGVIPASGVGSVDGCLDSANWCKISFEGTEGWASGDDVTAMVDDTPVVVDTNRDRVAVGTVTAEDNSAEGATGAIAGTMVAELAGALVGGMLGGGLGAAAAPNTTVTTYPVEPICLDGEVAVDAGIPDKVTLAKVADSDDPYADVNRVPGMVARAQRQIAHILR